MRYINTHKAVRALVLLTGFLFLTMASLPTKAESKKIYGLYERVQLPEWDNLVVEAKLDTGAVTSSLSVTDIEFFKKNNRDWVRFRPQMNGEILPQMEKEMVRYSRIKRRADDRKNQQTDATHSKRPVVLIELCFDGDVLTTEVNLTDRSSFSYPLLLGSSTLVELRAIVDPSTEFQSKGQCR